jgi:hypothetical protein
VKRPLLTGGGALIAFMGLVWTGQGLGYIGGSFMSGSLTWAVIGPIVALLGLFVATRGFREGRPKA